MDIRIRLMTESDVSQVNEVYNNAYGNMRPDSFFKWEFFEGPWGNAIYVIAEDLNKEGNKIIGTQSAIPIVMTNGKEQVLTAKSEDTFVDPSYRGQKLFERMYDLLFSECRGKGIKYIWGFTYARKPFEKIGFQIPFSSIQGIMTIKPLKAAKILASLNPANSLLTKTKILLGSYYSFGLSLLKNSGKSKNVERDFDYKSFSFNQSEQLIEQDLWSIQQNDEYLKWRLIKNPYPNDFTSYSKDGQSVIFNRKNDGVVYIEEMLLKGKFNYSEKSQFLKNAISAFKSKNSFSLIRFWGFETNNRNKEEIKILKNCGFTFVNKGTFFVWKSLITDKEIIDPFRLLISRLYTQGNR